MLFDERSDPLNQLAVMHAGGTGSLTGAAAQAEIKMPDDVGIKTETPFLQRAHRGNAATWRVHLRP